MSRVEWANKDVPGSTGTVHVGASTVRGLRQVRSLFRESSDENEATEDWACLTEGRFDPLAKRILNDFYEAMQVVIACPNVSVILGGISPVSGRLLWTTSDSFLGD